MKKVINDIFTGRNNKTYDMGRILIFIACCVYFSLSIWSEINSHNFNPINFGTGFGLLFAAGAGGLAIKSKTEPDQ